jgi:cholesterol transport system auxiliary component
MGEHMNNTLMRKIMMIGVILILSGCVGMGNKNKSANAVYDFGLTLDKFSLTSVVPVQDIVSKKPLDNTHIRYRLAYENEARVYSYAESHWSATPAELLTQKLKEAAGKPTQTNCYLQIELENFDHVFDSEQASKGVALMMATLVQKKTRTIVASQFFKEEVPASSQDAKGGVVALSQSGTQAINNIILWSNQQVKASGLCL